MSGSPDGGETSGCHYDLSDNLHVVLEGQKTVTLIPPGDTSKIYPRQTSDGLGAFESPYSAIHDISEHMSVVDEAARHQAFPRLREARRFTVTVNPGDVLFIPRSWWHQVTATKDAGPSTSINFWFRNAYTTPDKISKELVRMNYDLYLLRPISHCSEESGSEHFDSDFTYFSVRAQLHG